MSKKSEERLQKFLKNKQVLLASENSTDKTSWKKLFLDLGININNFEIVSTAEEARSVIEAKNVEIFLTSYLLDKKKTFPLIDLHIQRFPDRSKAFCFIASEKNSLALSALVAEKNVDGLLIKPYNLQDLLDIVSKTITDAVEMPSDIKTYHQIMANIRTSDLETAEKKAEAFVLKKPRSPNGHFLRGYIKEKQDHIDEAIGALNLAVKLDPLHHQSLCKLFDLHTQNKSYKSSYEVAESLTKNYPLNPTRVPDFIRAALATENFHSLIEFCEVMAGVDDDLIELKKPIAAALVISGKKLCDNPDQKSRDLIIQTARKAISLTKVASPVFITALMNLFNLGKFDIIREYTSEIPSDEFSIELIELDLKIAEAEEDASSVFVKAQNLIKLNKVSPDIYSTLIRSAKGIGKTNTQVEDIVFEGSKLFPEFKNYFTTLLA